MIAPGRTRAARREAPFQAWTGAGPVRALPGPAVSAAAPAPSVLLLAHPGAESEELFADLSRREDLCLIRVANAAAANRMIEEMPVALVIACPEVPPAAIDSVLAHLRRERPGTPVLAVRARRAQEPAGWSDAGVAVLRMPLLAGVLSRSIDVVLGMKRRR
jgi:DNA-binding response OmpR family regulator